MSLTMDQVQNLDATLAPSGVASHRHRVGGPGRFERCPDRERGHRPADRGPASDSVRSLSIDPSFSRSDPEQLTAGRPFGERLPRTKQQLGLAEEHRWVPNSGWITFHIRNEEDLKMRSGSCGCRANVEITEKPFGKGRMIFSGSLDQINEDVEDACGLGRTNWSSIRHSKQSRWSAARAVSPTCRDGENRCRMRGSASFGR